jgi:hydroxymethylbilane synthase
MPDVTVRVGSRTSRLAAWQTDHVIASLEAAWPGIRCERVPIRTLGDRVTDVPLPRIGDRGLFTRDIEDGLRGGTIDIAVHSLKDLPTEMAPGLALGAVLAREDPRDALVAAAGATLATLPAGARVGTSSIRRRAQILARRPDLTIVDIRGNVPTRLDKVARGAYDATLLAIAGLKRLGLEAAVTEVFAPEIMLPAPGQGALAVQVRADDDRVLAIVARLDDRPTRLATNCERGVLEALDGGCQAPVGTWTSWNGDTLRIRAIVASVDGTAIVQAEDAAHVTDAAGAAALATRLAAALKAQGAGRVIEACRAAVAAWPAEPREASA